MRQAEAASGTKYAPHKQRNKVEGVLKSHSDFVERADPKFPVAAYYFSPKEMPLHSRNATILVTEPFKVIDAVPLSPDSAESWFELLCHEVRLIRTHKMVLLRIYRLTSVRISFS